MGGGLGGGSSDAATTLLALNHLWSTGLTPEQLATIGLDPRLRRPGFRRWFIGLGRRPGRTPDARRAPERWFVVIHPRVHVPTAAVFQAPELTRNSPKITMRALFQTGGRNDCESVVRARFPEVADALDWLAQFGSSAPHGNRCLRVRGFRASRRRGARGRTRAGSLDELRRPGFEYLASAGARRSGPVKQLMRWGVAKR